MAIDLPFVWAAIIAFGVIMYVVMDGFDLGIGILFPFAPSDEDRDVMMNSVAPVWDGNETWLVLGGSALIGAFPLAYAVLLPAFYLPLILMLLALIFRGVAFEFRFKARRSRPWWDRSFAWGSAVATFMQGMVLGAFIRGVTIEERAFAGGTLDWLSPFSVFTGLALVAGYALLGATWLVMKAEGALQDWVYRASRPILLCVLAAIAVVSIWTPLTSPEIAQRWFALPNVILLSPVPLLVAATAWGLWRALERRSEYAPFLLALALFLLSYLGLAISLWPYVIPRSVTIWEAAAPEASMEFLLVGTLVLIPIILGYTAYTYWVFRGKTRGGYH